MSPTEKLLSFFSLLNSTILRSSSNAICTSEADESMINSLFNASQLKTTETCHGYSREVTTKHPSTNQWHHRWCVSGHLSIGLRQMPTETTSRKNWRLFLLMPILSQPLLPLVSGHFVSFPFFSARHGFCVLVVWFLKYESIPYFLPFLISAMYWSICFISSWSFDRFLKISKFTIALSGFPFWRYASPR